MRTTAHREEIRIGSALYGADPLLFPSAALSRPDAPPLNLVFHVAGVEAAYRPLVAAGMIFLALSHRPPWGDLRCFARDPDGYVIAIEDTA